MKIQTIDGRVTAEAETLAEVQTLLAFKKADRTPPTQKVAKVIGRHKGHVFYKKQCPVEGCGKRVKYLAGHLATHTVVPKDSESPMPKHIGFPGTQG